MASLKLTRLGDMSNHGGVIISASADVKVNGKGVCREGDMHACPIPGHGTTAMRKVSATTNWRVNGRAGINTGDLAGCGATVVNGSPDVFATT